ncbi:hypothetical protein EAI_12253 [Harpegnathos saltator]|uniref:Uncharacterized protein n=1 Tax=Harpegnathos saltator TaxID=610380 RepID=E2BC70_HARSA|nr:hypothetical protein EAI_12253 [Harpegnathos saltator]
MKKSPLSTPSGPNRRRHTPYNWNSHENANKRGYPSARKGYQSFPANDSTEQTCGGDFIPLNISTPVTQYKKYDSNWRSPRGGRNNSSPDSGGCNYRNSYNTPRLNCNNFNNTNGDKGVHRRVSISEYVDMLSFLEDPWEDLMKKLDESKDTSNDETPQSESFSNEGLIDSDSTEKSESKLPRNVNLNDSQCSSESKMDSSMDTTFGEDTVNISQTSKADSSIDLEIGDICFNQDESISSINDSALEATGDKDNASLVESVADIDEKNI